MNTKNKQELIKDIHLWHEDCADENCEIKQAIKENVPDDKLIEVTLDVDPELVERHNMIVEG